MGISFTHRSRGARRRPARGPRGTDRVGRCGRAMGGSTGAVLGRVGGPLRTFVAGRLRSGALVVFVALVRLAPGLPYRVRVPTAPRRTGRRKVRSCRKRPGCPGVSPRPRPPATPPARSSAMRGTHRWNRNPRPQPQTFGRWCFLFPLANLRCLLFILVIWGSSWGFDFIG